MGLGTHHDVAYTSRTNKLKKDEKESREKSTNDEDSHGHVETYLINVQHNN